MNNQFSGPNAWDDYLTALEQATPVIEAIAVTDYYVTDTYQAVLRHRENGRIPNASLIFPNVEVRLDVATASVLLSTDGTHRSGRVANRPCAAQ